MRATKALNFLPGFNLEGFPNRDSTVYGKLYGIEDANTILRGTIRYTGFSQSVRMLQFLGYWSATTLNSVIMVLL